MLQRTDIEQKLKQKKAKTTSEEEIMAKVYAILQAEIQNDLSVSENPENVAASVNNFNPDLLEADKVFHIKQIEQICVDYRLRFLDVHFFKSSIPSEALYQIERLEEAHDTSLENLKIMAPSKLFKLENADDPLLFAPMGNGYFHLIHKWGNDLHPLRKLLMKPFKCIENFVIFILALSFLVTYILPLHLFTNEPLTSVHFALVFLFTFKSIVGIAIFYGIALGKNFSENIWNSKYFNA